MLFFIFLGMTLGAHAQENDTAKVEKPAELPVISYSLSPKKYKIADIKVRGVEKTYEDYVLIGFLSGTKSLCREMKSQLR